MTLVKAWNLKDVLERLIKSCTKQKIVINLHHSYRGIQYCSNVYTQKKNNKH